MPCQQFPKNQPPANAKGGPFDTEQECKEKIGQAGGCRCCGLNSISQDCGDPPRYCCYGVCQTEACGPCPSDEACQVNAALTGYFDCGGGAWCPVGMVCFVGGNGERLCDPGAGPGVLASAFACCDGACVASFDIDDPCNRNP